MVFRTLTTFMHPEDVSATAFINGLIKLSHKLARGIGLTPRIKLVESNSIRRDQEISPLVIDLGD